MKDHYARGRNHEPIHVGDTVIYIPGLYGSTHGPEVKVKSIEKQDGDMFLVTHPHPDPQFPDTTLCPASKCVLIAKKGQKS